MRIIVAAVAILLLSGLSVMAQTQRQSRVPSGSYRQSCYNIRVKGDRLFAVCRREDGRWQKTVLHDVDNCVGGISNSNGTLQCRRRVGRSQPPAIGEGRGRAQRCGQLSGREQRLREQLEQVPSWDRDKRAALRERLQHTRTRYRNLGCDRWFAEHQRRCERLDADQHRLREQLERTPIWDQDRRAALNGRLREMQERSARQGCDRGYREQRDHCDRLNREEQQVREQLEQTPFWDRDRRRQLRDRLRDLRERFRNERCERR